MFICGQKATKGKVVGDYFVSVSSSGDMSRRGSSARYSSKSLVIKSPDASLPEDTCAANGARAFAGAGPQHRLIKDFWFWDLINSICPVQDACTTGKLEESLIQAIDVHKNNNRQQKTQNRTNRVIRVVAVIDLASVYVHSMGDVDLRSTRVPFKVDASGADRLFGSGDQTPTVKVTIISLVFLLLQPASQTDTSIVTDVLITTQGNETIINGTIVFEDCNNIEMAIRRMGVSL